MFSGSMSFLCVSTDLSELNYLDLSSNRLSGELPNCWEQFEELRVLNLANNSFFGKLPISMGSLYQIKALQLRNNNFSRELPMSLKKCIGLRIIDLGGNRLSGKIQEWIGTYLSGLIVFSLRSNNFYGSIPERICHLNDIQVLDFSHNDLSGNLPWCFDNFSSLVRSNSLEEAIDFGFISGTFIGIYEGSAVVQWKGQEREYKKKLRLLKVIDLSSNKLVGKIPEQIFTLVELVSLNWSRNNLSGKITQNIGSVKMLEALDLSQNGLSGEIPTSLARLNYLSVLDLSNNNLSGKIPLSTQLQSFDASAYAGNSQLCGPPLPHKCPGKETDVEPSVTPHGRDDRVQEDEDGFLTPGFYISMGVGFAVGFRAVVGIMLFSSSSRNTCFKFLEQITDWCYVTTAIYMGRLQRRLWK